MSVRMAERRWQGMAEEAHSAPLACRACAAPLRHTFVDLGLSPLANSYLEPRQLRQPERFYPLHVHVCEQCLLVQLEELESPERIFGEYAYFSSYSSTWLKHSRRYADAISERLGLGGGSLVVEIASNDGYLLRRFRDDGIPILGIDPSPGPAAVAADLGVPTLVEFFGAEMAARLRAEGKAADVVIANNVMAHVPDLNGFVAGLATLVAEDGVVTIENPYVRDLIAHGEFDTIYHEHYCYFSCSAVDRLLRRHGLHLNKVEHFPRLHGGTLRWWAARGRNPHPSVTEYLEEEQATGVDRVDYYAGFGTQVGAIQQDLIGLLFDLRKRGARIVAYGAAAKGATLLNSTRVPHALMEYVVDRNPHKQGWHMPGTHLEIRSPQAIADDPPDYVLLLAWNHASEIMRQLADYRSAGGKFIVPIPTPQIVC
jgi:SAM-dependent methyltransferase